MSTQKTPEELRAFAVKHAPELTGEITRLVRRQGGWKPVAWLYTGHDGHVQAFTNEPPPRLKELCMPLYAHAQQQAKPPTPDQESREMFVTRLENMQENGNQWITVIAVLALLNDCDMLASRSAERATGCPETMDDTARFAADELPAILKKQAG